MILNTSQTSQMVYDTNFNPVDIMPKFLMNEGILPKPPKNVYEVKKLPYSWAKRTDLAKELTKSDIKTVILCRRFGLGDIIQLIPSLAYLQENYPHIKFIFATIPDFIPLFQSDDRYKVINARYIGIIKYDLGVNLDYSVEQDLMLGSDLRFKHRIHTYAGMLGISLKNPVIDLKISEEAIAWANNLVEKSKKNKRKVIVLQMEGTSVSRQLPSDLMLHLAKTLNQLCDVALVDKNSVKADVKYNLTSKTDLQQLMAIIKVADALISFDSGCLWLSHIAKTPILTLMGPTRPQEKLSLHPLYPERARAVMVNEIIGCPKSCLYQGGSWCGEQFRCMANLPSEYYDRVINRIVKGTIALLNIKKSYKYISVNERVNTEIPDTIEIKTKKKEEIKSILVKMTSGELGDKLVVMTLMSGMRRKYPDIQLDVYLQSIMFNAKDGYCRLFKDCCDNCFVDEREITKRYDKIYKVSAQEIHREEITDARNGYLQISRTQRWARQLGFIFNGEAKSNYKIRDEFGESIRRKVNFTNLKHPIIGIAPLTSNRCKEWESIQNGKSPKWQAVIDYLSWKKCSCVTINYASLKYNNCLNLGDLNLDELGYVISKLDLLIASEAGISHFAGILGIPMIVLMGASPIVALRHYKNTRIIRHGNCIECMRHLVPDFGRETKCGSYVVRNKPNSECIIRITPKEVIEMLKNFKGKEFKEKFSCLL